MDGLLKKIFPLQCLIRNEILLLDKNNLAREQDKAREISEMGRNWAIAIGINIYENLSSLKYAKRDAEAIADWFGQDAKFDQVFLFTADSPAIEQTNPPIPTSPTYGHLRRFLRAQFENIERPLLKPEDNLWFFFAGHARFLARGKD